jgi:hypothetical protein
MARMATDRKLEWSWKNPLRRVFVALVFCTDRAACCPNEFGPAELAAWRGIWGNPVRANVFAKHVTRFSNNSRYSVI